MRIEIKATGTLAELEGVQVRLWEGTTEAGIPCKVFIHRIAVANAHDSSQFDAELVAKLPPARFK